MHNYGHRSIGVFVLDMVVDMFVIVVSHFSRKLFA